MMEPVLTLRGISAYDRAGRALVSSVDLTVLPGERVQVLAERPRFEALARIAGRLLPPDSGEAILRGKAGYVSDEPGFWEDMTVLDNTALPLMAAGVPRRTRREAAMEQLESLGLGYSAHAYPRSMSLCEQRLAALARALTVSPALLILAGPASMLDEKETARFQTALARRWETDRFAALFSAWDGGALLPAGKTIKL